MTSRLAQMQAQFQQKQMEVKEQKLLKLYESQQQRVFDRVGRSSAGSNTSNASTTSLGSTGGGKVRAMFDERRHKAGVDKSYPLKPLETRNNGRSVSLGRQANESTKTVVKSTIKKNVNHVVQNVNKKQEVNSKRTVHQALNNNYDDAYGSNGENKPHAILEHKNSTTGLLNMLNNHNLNDDLDSQHLPDEVEFQDDYKSQPLFMTGKLANLGGKLPSEMQKETATKISPNGISQRNPSNHGSNNNAPTKTTSVVPKSKPKPAPRTPSSTESSAPTSPIKQNMSNKATPSSAQRAPLNNRPSSKQSAKSAIVRDDLAECKFCGRRFATDRLAKHEDICGKTARKKRKAYDSTKHRVLGTELEGYVLKGPKKSGAKVPPKVSSTGSAKTNWRRTHEEFVAAIRAAKQAQAHLAKGGKLSDLPPPPPSSNPDYVQCPHCGRKFNEAAAERHIPKCSTFQFNKPKGGASKPGKR